MRRSPASLVWLTLLLLPAGLCDEPPSVPTIVKPIEAIPLESLPAEGVKVEILERVQRVTPEEALAQANAGGSDTGETGAPIDPIDASWSSPPDSPTEAYVEPAFGFPRVVAKYSSRGIKTDRSSPFLIRASSGIVLPPGEHRLLLRALGGARLILDGQVIATTRFIARRYSDNEEVPDLAGQMLVSGVRLLPAGHSEALATVRGDGARRVFTLEAFVGGKKMRPETGELSVSISKDGGPFRLLTTAAESATLDDPGWTGFAQEQRLRLNAMDAQRRRPPQEEAYWAMRRERAREIARGKPAPVKPAVAPETPVFNDVDRFIGAKLEKAGVQPAALASDLAFLRRVTLDTAGVIPTPAEVSAFLADQAADRRSKVIDRLLADPRWADAWVPYWQDVLGENPAILKATLNNTGPFRFWIQESLADNKPFDRFVTELVSMEGSLHYGGPAGFAMATQNDVPMAAKAQVLSTAFLGLEMKCARCHDAPSHSYNQADLFGIAGMLERGPLKVPATSSVAGLSATSPVTVTLKPGSAVDAHWPFGEFAAEPLPGVIRKPGDSRELLAAIITDPRNERFPQVIANRVWKRFFGFGLVEPVDDWETARPSHPELLRWLGREFVLSGYDLKHLTRLILNSNAYQRTVTPAGSLEQKTEARLFQSQSRRRMTAEQLVDSLFTAAGKQMNTEILTFDGDGRRSIQDFQNLGQPARAWEFAPLSNERDRPALALPRAQAVLDVLAAYGWRESRPDPRTSRDHDPNVIQPATLANGIMGARITRLSDDSAFTALALKAESPEALATDLFTSVLTRSPATEEAAALAELLTPGFAERLRVEGPGPPHPRPPTLRAVTWSNHLHADATTIKLQHEAAARAGDPPSGRLAPGWRERAEDAVWALMLSPEFVFVP